MNDTTRLAADQLRRMRGMTALYHRRFFLDINLTTVLIVGLFVTGWAGIDEAFLLIPFVALIGAAQTAFDSSYLVFARTYAARLERFLNENVGSRILVGAEMEDAYLFPLQEKKIVTIPLTARAFSWFSFVTIFYTVIGVAAFGFGLAAGWDTLRALATEVIAVYVTVLAALTVAALGVGIWWFVAGTGEQRLVEVLERRFDAPKGS